MLDVKALIDAAEGCRAKFSELEKYFSENHLPSKPGRAELAARFKSLFSLLKDSFNRDFPANTINAENLVKAYARLFTIYVFIYAHRDMINETLSANTNSVSTMRSYLGSAVGAVAGENSLQSEGDKYVTLLTGILNGIEGELNKVKHEQARILDTPSLLPNAKLTGDDILINPKYLSAVVGTYGRDVYNNVVNNGYAKGHVNAQGRNIALINAAGALLGPVGLAATAVGSYVYCDKTDLTIQAASAYKASDIPLEVSAQQTSALVKSVLSSDKEARKVTAAFTPIEYAQPVPKKRPQHH